MLAPTAKSRSSSTRCGWFPTTSAASATNSSLRSAARTGSTTPGCRFLITKERSRRIKLLRYRKRGIDYSPVSFEEYLSYPDAQSEEQQAEEW